MRKKFIALISIPLLLILSAGAFAGDITATGRSDADLYTWLKNATSSLLNKSTSAPGLALSFQTATRLRTANTLQYAVGGYLYTKAANAAISGTGAVQAASTYCLYLVSIDNSGWFTITKGTAVSTDAAVLPALPANSAPVGVVKVVTASTKAFTLGSTEFSATGVTSTYTDMGTMVSGASKVSLTGL